MEEVKIKEKVEEMKKIEKKEEPAFKKEKSMKDMVSDIHETFEEAKKKKIKLPRKARVKKRRMKKGWVGTLIIDENRNIKGERVKLKDSCFNEKDGTYHASNGEELFWFDGKYPVLIQPTWRINPLNIKKDMPEDNETYGQKYIKARMLADVIKVKAKGSSALLWIIGLAIAGYLGYSLITGGF
jgi:hypothetical protein